MDAKAESRTYFPALRCAALRRPIRGLREASRPAGSQWSRSRTRKPCRSRRPSFSCWESWGKNLAALHFLQAVNDESHALVERDPEARHAGIGDRDFPAFALLEKYRDHSTPAFRNIAVTGARKMGTLGAGVGICLHKHLPGATF